MKSASLLLSLLLLSRTAGVQSVRPVLTRAQAIQTAADFCQRIGAPADGDATTEFPEEQDIRWQPCWKVSFMGGPTVEIVDAGSVVCSYSDSRIGWRLNDGPEGMAISEDDAIRRATAALLATGEQADMAFSHAALEQGASPARAASRVWRVSWTRQFQGVPYSLPDGARVSLNAETGEVNGLAVVFQTPPPVPSVVLVSAEAAADIANNQIVQANIVDAAPFRLEAEVVRPNMRWQPGENEEPLPGLPRIAWKATFCAGEKYPVVYVDAETGKVIGGEHGAPRGRVPVVPVVKRLREAREVRIFRRAKNGTWPAKPLGVLSEKSDAVVFAALKKAGKQPAGPPKSFADYKVVLITDKQQRDELAYISKSGLLGAGQTWVAAPLELRNWLKNSYPVDSRK